MEKDFDEQIINNLEKCNGMNSRGLVQALSSLQPANYMHMWMHFLHNRLVILSVSLNLPLKIEM
jgi:hypothetical protein